jgi:hypothetical protein
LLRVAYAAVNIALYGGASLENCSGIVYQEERFVQR